MQSTNKLEEILRQLSPQLNTGEYVFIPVNSVENIPRKDTLCEFREKEGTTVVLERNKADELGLSYEHMFSWITLDCRSALDAVGLTAAFSTALAKNGISCNVIAGYYHDHIFVNKNDGETAMQVLTQLSKGYKTPNE